jgi:serine/threonine protein phosphatase PrpC
MQGWRKTQEDTHICHLNIGEDMNHMRRDVQLFGVFDGHGGNEVSILIKEIFLQKLVKLDSFVYAKYACALEQTFLAMDEYMLSAEGKKDLEEVREKFGYPKLHLPVDNVNIAD